LLPDDVFAHVSLFRGFLAGVAVAIVVESLLYATFGLLTPVGGLLGSAVAGIVGATEPRRGGAVGLAVAVAWGLPLVVAAAYLALATGDPSLWPFAGLVRSADPTLALLAVAIGLTLPNALLGVAGALLGERREHRGITGR
jgi:hypothetical protein